MNKHELAAIKQRNARARRLAVPVTFEKRLPAPTKTGKRHASRLQHTDRMDAVPSERFWA